MVLFTTTIVARRLGTASMIALIMSGQVIASLVSGNFGLLGLELQPANVPRLLAAALLLAGAALMLN